MLDPTPPPPSYLLNLTKPFADRFNFPSLPYHIHEVLFALVLYQSVQSIVSPALSRLFFPKTYNGLTQRTRVNWDVHVVSLVQSLLINGLALWVMFTDEERGQMSNSVVERVYGYTGASGLIQALACGYFLWDLVVSTRYIKIFGIGIWCHAITALMVFSFGFRPFCNYYGPPFILYELSSPFLNVHWFCDKLNLTGSSLQWYNGMILLFTFFSCRLVWGTYQSARVYMDVWQLLHMDTAAAIAEGQAVTSKAAANFFSARDGSLCLGDRGCVAAQAEVMKFVGPKSSVPYWLIAIYVVSNLTLNFLNWYWFGKMIETVRKRFEGKPHDEWKHEKGINKQGRRKSVIEHAADSLDQDTLSGPKTPGLELSEKAAMAMSSGVDGAAGVNMRRRDL